MMFINWQLPGSCLEGARMLHESCPALMQYPPQTNPARSPPLPSAGRVPTLCVPAHHLPHHVGHIRRLLLPVRPLHHLVLRVRPLGGLHKGEAHANSKPRSDSVV